MSKITASEEHDILEESGYEIITASEEHDILEESRYESGKKTPKNIRDCNNLPCDFCIFGVLCEKAGGYYLTLECNTRRTFIKNSKFKF